MAAKKVLIMGAAGRDFHNFNVIYRDNKDYDVVAFTAAQIPDIEGRTYPPSLAGKLYPKGIPIYSENDLTKLIEKHKVQEVIFSYSDVPYPVLMNKAAIVNAHGADFILLDATRTMIKSKVPIIAICAVRTGCGKSQTTRKVIDILKAKGRKVVAIRHPMPYGDLEKQKVQRFAEYKDLDFHKCTIEEREEYEPHIDNGIVVYAGVDYGAILKEAEKEADIIIWDGGNNDTPFYKPDLHITIVDPHRPGHELAYYPGETNLRMADVVVVNKITTADPDKVDIVLANSKFANPEAIVVKAASPVTIDDKDSIRGKKILIIEDGPTLTHGEMSYGAGMVAAKQYGAGEIVDPLPYIVGEIKKTFEKYPHVKGKKFLPAMGYSDKQIADLKATIDATPCDIVLAGTPIDLNRVLTVNKPIVRVYYELEEISKPDLKDVLKKF
ncbi:MAG: cyclic 2,3-diphosphoglycerate synthase [Thermoplasmata archaeon]|nr:cyclic 2,3-diphosphoglycerate synthase [Thermoplasmata archaeon]